MFHQGVISNFSYYRPFLFCFKIHECSVIGEVLLRHLQICIFSKSDNGLKSYCPLKFEWKEYFLPAFWDSGLSLFKKNLGMLWS